MTLTHMNVHSSKECLIINTCVNNMTCASSARLSQHSKRV